MRTGPSVENTGMPILMASTYTIFSGTLIRLAAQIGAASGNRAHAGHDPFHCCKVPSRRRPKPGYIRLQQSRSIKESCRLNSVLGIWLR